MSKKEFLTLLGTFVFSVLSILYSLETSYFVSLLYGNTVTIYSLTIGSYMLFLGLGAILYEKLKGLGVSVLLFTETLLSLVAFFAPLGISYVSSLFIPYTYKILFSFFVLGVIGLFSGIELPLLMGLNESRVSYVIGADYAGGLVGSLLYVFYLLPNVDTVAIFYYTAFFNLFFAISFYLLYTGFKDVKKPLFVVVVLLLGISFYAKAVKESKYYFINKRLSLKVYL